MSRASLLSGAARTLGWVVLTACLLSGCGGGGGSSSTPAASPSAPSGTQTYSVTGNVTGLASGTSVVLAVDGQHQSVTQNGGFSTGLALGTGSSYSVTVATQPTGETCTVSNGSGTIASSNINNIQVACSANPAQTYTISGGLTGLASGATLVLQNNGGDNLTVNANGSFTFATALVNQAAYDVTVLTQPTGQTCSIAHPAGTVQGANVTSVAVSCANSPPPAYTIGGSVTGLSSGTGVTLQENGADSLFATNGSFTFSQAVGQGATYAVTILTQPQQETCSASNGSGIATANVTNVQIACAANAYSIGGTLGGLAVGTSVVLQDNGSDNLTLTNNGAFTFTQSVAAFSSYNVTVLTQPLHQVCTVANPSMGTAVANVTNVAANCAPGPEYAYVANEGSNTVSQYTIGAGGALSPMTPATVTAGTYPYSVTVDPTGQYAYVANEGSNTVSQYTIGAGGALSPMTPATVASGRSPTSVTIDPTGKYAYVANAGSNNVSQYTIGAGGLLSPMTPATVAAGTSPLSVTVDPTGKYAYVANEVSGNVSQYTIGADGALTPMTPATVAADGYTYSVTVDPTGKYAYVTDVNTGNVSQYTIGAGGALTPMTPATVAAVSSPISVTVDPTGNYVYVANEGTTMVSQYTIGAGGALSPMTPATVTTGASPYSVTVDPTGTYAYVANEVSNTVSQYTIGAGGALSPMTPATVAAGTYPYSVTVAQP